MNEKISTYSKETGNLHIEAWWGGGERHRLNGPAYIEYYPNGKVGYESWKRVLENNYDAIQI